MSVDLVATPQPHFIPGYTGYCPQYRYRVGHTYGGQTHKLLLDPTVSHSEKLVLSDRTVDDYQVYRPPERDIDIVKARFRFGDTVYQHPFVPGYEGFVPRQNGLFGQRFSVVATEALAEDERQRMKDRSALNQLNLQVALQSGRYCPRDLDDRQLTESQFRLPLLAVRPERVGVLRTLPITEPAMCPLRQSTSPFFMENLNPEKYLKLGYGGHVPFGYSRFGQGHQQMTNSALCDFSSNYRHRQSTEWAPVSVSRPDPPMLIQPTEIYHKHVGLIPNYQGHVPGAQFRYGKTYGSDTRDAKRWLRGDFNT
ncbi:CIMIP2 protein CG18335-like [Periplaneta americana]|uniref:CIMIP2 protein CG18335-like n=1 Tax=Periplaneta americana TaxID=6978 RepID=UPI0037E7A1AE